MNINWQEEFQVAITISDTQGNVLYMNQKAAKTFESYGGKELIGKSLLNCHKPESVEKILKLLSQEKTNVYTIEKNGVKKLIYQSPWYENGICMGLIELSLEIPFEMPHFIR